MALVVFLRGINVGGHRRFPPSVLAKELSAYDVVNVGNTGTLIVRKPGARAKFFAEQRRTLPFEAEAAYCNGGDLVRLEAENPFGPEPSGADVVRFVSVVFESCSSRDFSSDSNSRKRRLVCTSYRGEGSTGVWSLPAGRWCGF
jgi:hypothetical protein